MISAQIKSLLNATLAPEKLELIDDSAAHAGHVGARTGGGHYFVTVVSAAFEGKTMVQRHQMIYQALGDMMKHEIHALGINALTPSEDNN